MGDNIDFLLSLLKDSKEILKNETLIKLTDDEIMEKALDYAKSNKVKIIDFLVQEKYEDKSLILTLGFPGAGKSELLKALSKKKKLNIIDIDEIRTILPNYTGQKSSLFQKASSRIVNEAVNYCLKKRYSLAIDSNLADFNIAKNNVKRALKRGYKITINYVYTNLEEARENTLIRESNDGRKVPYDIFIKKAIGFIKTMFSFFEEFQDDIDIIIFDSTKNKIYLNDLVKFTEITKDDYLSLKSLNKINEINFVKKQVQDYNNNLIDLDELEDKTKNIEDEFKSEIFDIIDEKNQSFSM